MIRRGKIGDLNVLMKFLNDTPELGGGLKEETYSQDYVKACLTDKDRDIVLILEDKGVIVGFLIAELWKNKKYSFLIDLFVKPDYRKMGIARKLIKEHERVCKKLGLKRISGLVLVNNFRMHKFMKKTNFKRGNALYFYEKNI